jgi:hypothetical protein
MLNGIEEDYRQVLAHKDDFCTWKTHNHYPVGWAQARTRSRGVGPAWSDGRLMAASRVGKRRRAAANPRGIQGYAAGRQFKNPAKAGNFQLLDPLGL